MCQATKLVTMKASSFQALGVGAKVVEEVCLLKRNTSLLGQMLGTVLANGPPLSP